MLFLQIEINFSIRKYNETSDVEANIATLRPCMTLKNILAVSSFVLLIIRLNRRLITLTAKSTSMTRF